MSALGQKPTYAVQTGMTALPPKSGHAQRHRLVRSTGTQSTRLTFALSGALLQQVMLGHARGKQDDANH